MNFISDGYLQIYLPKKLLNQLGQAASTQIFLFVREKIILLNVLLNYFLEYYDLHLTFLV